VRRTEIRAYRERMTRLTWDELTPREAEVLAAVERRLGNAEIAAEQHISVRTVESHIAALRRKLRVDSRAGLVSAARRLRGSTVPVPGDSFVGRDGDVAAVRTLLDRSRWVTVVGAPGCGKTRLALEVAAGGPAAPVVVDLAHAAAGAVPAVVAKGIGLAGDVGPDPVSASGVALAAQAYLLVLDNCDRVTADVADLVARLLGHAPDLRVLATCRSPVGGPGEALHELLPLPVDDGGAAARLFLDRAASATTEALAGATAELVDRICRRLDGLPLAIELAAARVRHLGVPELAEQLDHGFGPLDRAGPANRHRTLESAFDWTWDLLDDEEQRVLCRLAALPRTFDLALAEHVTSPGAGRVVLRLLDRSLVSPTVPATVPRRFRLLESLREFVVARTAPATADDVRRLHAGYYADLAGQVRARARLDDSPAAAAHARLLCPEVNAAADWALTAGEPELALALTTALAVGGEQYGPDVASLEAIARAARDDRVRAAAGPVDLLDLGIALCYCDLHLVGELAGLALSRATDPWSELAARHLAGYAQAYAHHGPTALEHLDVAEQLADELLATWQLASVRQGRGLALRELGDRDGAMAAFEAAMHTFALAGDALHVNNARYMMAATAAEDAQRVDQVVAWTDQCVAYGRDVGNTHELAHALLTRASVAGGADPEGDLAEALAIFRAVGDLRCLTRGHLLLSRWRPAAEAVGLLEQALDCAVRAHDEGHQATALERLVALHWDRGEHRQAAVRLGALTALVGPEEATRRSPPDLARRTEDWSSSIAEGQARGLSATSPGSR
jgi:predicted ATPase/DNA-binding CsgD family transcriptional regulator